MPKLPNPFSALAEVYYNWKSLQLPWRKQFLAGRDLQGNTYWEFRDIRSGSGGQGRGTRASAVAAAAAAPGQRMRRIVQYPKGTHPGDVRVPPQWHQWLRHVRAAAPTLAEQEAEVARQRQMRLLAARADARWAGAQRVEGPIEAMATETVAQPQPQPLAERQPPQQQQAPAAAAPPPPPPEDDPWKKEERARGNPGEAWAPAAWTPPSSAAARQRRP